MLNKEDEWKSQKLGKIGSSNVSKLFEGGSRPMTEDELRIEKENKGRRKTVDTLFGKGANTYLMEKVAEIITGQHKEEISMKATEWGEDCESHAIEHFVELTGLNVEYFGSHNPKWFAYNSFSGASPDALGEGFNVETKSPFVSSNHVGYLIASKSPETAVQWMKDNHFDYYCQCQMAMMSCKTKLTKFLSFDIRALAYSNKMAIIDIPLDTEHEKETHYRVNEGGKVIKSTLDLLLPKPSILLATPTPGGVIVEGIK